MAVSGEYVKKSKKKKKNVKRNNPSEQWYECYRQHKTDVPV